MAEVVKDDEARLQLIRRFSAFVFRLGDGTADLDAMAQLDALLDALHACAKRTSVETTGIMTFKVTAKVDPEGQCRFGYGIDTKEPKLPTRGSVAWRSPISGKLTFKDPKQQEFGFVREVATQGVNDVPAEVSGIEAGKAVEV